MFVESSLCNMYKLFGLGPSWKTRVDYRVINNYINTGRNIYTDVSTRHTHTQYIINFQFSF